MISPPQVDPSEPRVGGAAKPALRREWLLLALSLLLLVGVVAPPLVNLGRYQRLIADTMSRSLDRPVTMRSVSLRLIPAPALVLSDVVVDENRAFGAEPALRAPTVVAALRLTSLWRGQLEVSRVEISEASVNLVRDSAGRWNIGSVLLQASHVQNAPTSQRRSGPAPRFPYIEMTDSRVNVKQGAEKLPYSLLNANLSMWLAEPEIWRIRMDAQPVRTDLALGLADTGLVRVEGSLHRATAVGRMPLALHLDWSNAPLGQVSRLLLGRDGGWRGELHASADVTGDLDGLGITSRLAVANLHRQEFTPVEPFTVDATCRASYSRAAERVSGIACVWPVGTGWLLLGGDMARASDPQPQDTGSHWEPSLELTAKQLPASFLLAAAGLARSDLATELRVQGPLDGAVDLAPGPPGAPALSGALTAPALRLTAGDMPAPLVLNQVRLAITRSADPAPSGALLRAPLGGFLLVLNAAPVDLGGATPVELSAELGPGGALFHAVGGASVARLQELARASHLLPAMLSRLAPQGTAEFDLTRRASSQSAADPAALVDGLPADADARPSLLSGSVRLHNARYTPGFLPGGVDLPLATVTFFPGEVLWTAPAAVYDHRPVQITAQVPLGCVNGPCPVRFRAAFATLDLTGLASALGQGDGRPALWNALLNRLDARSSPGRSPWPTMTGTVHAAAFAVGRLGLRNVDATVSIADGRARIESLEAQALGGALRGEGAIATDAGAPHYVFHLALAHASAAAAGMLFHEPWGDGTVNLTTDLRLQGETRDDLLFSASGRFQAEWLRGGLGAGTPLAHFARWTAEGSIGSRALTFADGELSTASGATPVTGRIGFDRSLALTLGTPDAPVALDGILSRPAVGGADSQ